MVREIKYTDAEGKEIDLEIYYDRWTDPGDYPSGAGAGPLPSGPYYVDDISGTVRFQLTREIRWELLEYPSLQEWVKENVRVPIPGVEEMSWNVGVVGNQVELRPWKWKSE